LKETVQQATCPVTQPGKQAMKTRHQKTPNTTTHSALPDKKSKQAKKQQLSGKE